MDIMYVRDKSVVYCAWKDTKCILLLSTQHPGHSENTVKCNTKDSTGKFVKNDVPIPSSMYSMYVRDKSVVYCAWKDTKCILLLSTQHPGHSENTVKHNTKDSTGKFVKNDVPIPSPVYFYEDSFSFH